MILNTQPKEENYSCSEPRLPLVGPSKVEILGYAQASWIASLEIHFFVNNSKTKGFRHYNAS